MMGGLGRLRGERLLVGDRERAEGVDWEAAWGERPMIRRAYGRF